MSNKLYVGNLSYQASDQDLQELFKQAGGVESVKIVIDAYSGRSRGFGFVEMSSNEEAQNAIKMFNGYRLKDREIVVSEARPQRSSGGRGGREGGGYREGSGYKKRGSRY